MPDILALPNWSVLSVEHSEKLIINAECQIHPDSCLKCGSTSLYKHGPKRVVYRDIPINGSPVVINAVLKRYRCRDCSSTFIQPVTGMRSKMRMTERCCNHIRERCFKEPHTAIAREIGCSEKTVRMLCNQCYEI